MNDLFDVVIVGAGPGGSNAATVALRRGLTVAQVDRARFPRVKPCGGGVTVRSFAAVQRDITPVLRGSHASVEFNVWRRRTNEFTNLSTTMLRMVVRPEFDNWMVEQNSKESGFAFFDDEKVLDISFRDGLFHVCTAKRVLKGRHLVGADGAYSLVNKTFEIARPKGFAVAAEVVLDRSRFRLRSEVSPCFDFGAVDKGYGWIFPKDDHWNVGLYSLAKLPKVREQLRAYIRDRGFEGSDDPLATLEAHQFPYGGYRIKQPDAPVYLVGDAAGLGDAILGEGIYHALESGRLAGEVIADCVEGKARPSTYYERLRAGVQLDAFATYQLARHFYIDVDKAVTILENPIIWRSFVQGFVAGATISRTILVGPRYLLQSLVSRSLRCRREGPSLPLALAGPLRGVPYICEPFLRGFQREVESLIERRLAGPREKARELAALTERTVGEKLFARLGIKAPSLGR